MTLYNKIKTKIYWHEFRQAINKPKKIEVPMISNIHKPVLLNEVVSLLKPASGEFYLDLTAGYGGHAQSFLRDLGVNGRATLVDRDINSINYLKKLFAVDNRVEFIHNTYESASQELASSSRRYDCILADLGISSPHLDNPDRGFSFMNDGPLDMRMDQSASLTAAEVVNEYSAEDLANVLYKYGEFTNSRDLAKKIIACRPFKTTNELASVIPDQRNRNKILARIFQAIRIEVNDELGQLERSLGLWLEMLKPGGRLAIISFHSLEDRIIKDYFRRFEKGDMLSEFVVLNKKPLVAGPDEIVHNPRSRSAKLRGLQRK